MTYQDSREVGSGFGKATGAPVIEPPDTTEAIDRASVARSLSLTPSGREAWAFYQRMEFTGKAVFVFRIVPEIKIEGKNKLARLIPDPSGVDPPAFEVRLVDQAPHSEDRSFGWGFEERLNIVAVHERHHLRPDGVTWGGDQEDFRPHAAIIRRELQARWEFTMLDPLDLPAQGPEQWLSNYRSFLREQLKRFQAWRHRDVDAVLNQALLDAVNSLYGAGYGGGTAFDPYLAEYWEDSS